MKIENVKVGMRVKVKQCCTLSGIRGKIATVLNVRDSAIYTGRKVVGLEIDGDKDWDVYLESIKKYKEPVLHYDISEKAWLLREVVVNDNTCTPSLIGEVGHISGVGYDGLILVQFENWNEGHDGGSDRLKCGWLGERDCTSYWWLDVRELSLVNKDGSLTPMVSTPMLEEKV